VSNLCGSRVASAAPGETVVVTDAPAPDPRIVELADPGGELVAHFAAGAGMVGCSLRHRGEELLALRAGLGAYVAQGKTFGVPLLYPWANRLGGWGYEAAGRSVEIDRDSPLVRADEHGLPIHGALARHLHWEIMRREPAALSAELDWSADRRLIALFPFEHRVGIDVRLEPGALQVRTSVRAASAGPVPLAFGFHPYLAPPGAPRAAWELELPARTELSLDERGLPDGGSRALPAERLKLGERAFDDLFAVAEGASTFAVTGGGRRLAVDYGPGYPYAQVFAPPGQDLVCFEPMTAPTNALRSGQDLPVVAAGEAASATFALRVDAA
jgi:aldose 1-epimerase